MRDLVTLLGEVIGIRVRGRGGAFLVDRGEHPPPRLAHGADGVVALVGIAGQRAPEELRQRLAQRGVEQLRRQRHLLDELRMGAT
ncbi:MAG: hypothetical protein ACRDRZ_00910 [Pseudonocardiaceae bacterium]